ARARGPGEGPEDETVRRRLAGGGDGEGHRPAPGPGPEGRRDPGRDRGEGGGDAPPRERPGHPQEGARPDEAGLRRPGGDPRRAGEGGEARLDRTHLEGPRLRNEAEVDRGTGDPSPGKRKIARRDSHHTLEKREGAGPEGFRTPDEGREVGGHALRRRGDPTPGAEGLGAEDPREGEGTRQTGGRAPHDGAAAPHAV